MPEQLLDHLGVQPSVQGERRAGVPSVVEPDDRHAGPLGEALEELPKPVGVVAAAVGLDEDEPALGDGMPSCRWAVSVA